MAHHRRAGSAATVDPVTADAAPCIFCAIVTGDAPSTQVYEDDDILAFLDIRPITRGHTLVIPKRHASRLADLDPDLGASMFRVGHRLVAAVRSGLSADGANVLINDGKPAFQTVDHTHLHVVPRQRKDVLRFAAGLVLRRNDDPDGAAAAIRSALTEAK